jgi:hypothetical protein
MPAGRRGGGPNTVLGHITPSYFRFEPTNPVSPDGTPGWRAVCIHAVTRNGNTGDTTLCQFEVGLPLRDPRDGERLLEERRICARLANHAAYAVMKDARPDELTAVVCNRFKRAYQDLLRQQIPQATVGACVSKGLSPVIFNVSLPDFLSPP